MGHKDECPAFADLAEDMANWHIPPHIVVLMTGVQHAKQVRDGSITLVYADGTEESAPCPDVELKDTDNFFGVVDLVQSRARATQEA